MLQTLVAVKRGDEWRLTAFQYTRALYMGGPQESASLTEELRHELSLASKQKLDQMLGKEEKNSMRKVLPIPYKTFTAFTPSI